MLIIKKLSEDIRDELDDACKYIQCAIEHKEDYPDLASAFYSLAKEELGHADKLHEQAVDIIKSVHEEVPETMKTLWDFEHKIFVEKREKAEFKIAQYSKY